MTDVSNSILQHAKHNGVWLLVLLAWMLGGNAAAQTAVTRNAIDQSLRRSVQYLSSEVATWKEQHKCYSCHNNGDGARAIFAAKKAGLEPSAKALQVNAAWVSLPDQWDHNGPDGPFSDRKLARIQFAAALVEAIESKIVADRQPLFVAAEQLVKEQQMSGAWDFEGADSLGGPTTYGRALATVLAQRVLVVADPQRYAVPIGRTDEWLRKLEPQSVIDSAAVLIGLRGAKDNDADVQRRRCREILRRGQGDDGGWGPYVTASPEAFDTALGVLALHAEADDAARQSAARGVAFLVRNQLSDGSWPETTRPVPRESYSQRISTTAWATLALLGAR